MEALQGGILDSSSNSPRQVLLSLVQILSANVLINYPFEVSPKTTGQFLLRNHSNYTESKHLQRANRKLIKQMQSQSHKMAFCRHLRYLRDGLYVAKEINSSGLFICWGHSTMEQLESHPIHLEMPVETPIAIRQQMTMLFKEFDFLCESYPLPGSQ